MQLKILITVVTALAIAVMLTAAARPSASRDIAPSADVSALAELLQSQSSVLAIKAGTTTDDTATFTVPYGARVFELGNKSLAITAAYKRPLQGSFNMTKGTGQISMADALPANAVFDDLDNASIPVAGVNVVVALQEMRLAGIAGGHYAVEFGKISFYLPNGYRNSYVLDRPARVSFSPDRMTLTMDIDPMVTATMSYLIRPENAFPADAVPLVINDVLSAYLG